MNIIIFNERNNNLMGEPVKNSYILIIKRIYRLITPCIKTINRFKSLKLPPIIFMNYSIPEHLTSNYRRLFKFFLKNFFSFFMNIHKIKFSLIYLNLYFVTT